MESREKDEHIIELRRRGWSFGAIAAQVRMSEGAVKRALRRIERPK